MLLRIKISSSNDTSVLWGRSNLMRSSDALGRIGLKLGVGVGLRIEVFKILLRGKLRHENHS